jgi:FlaA1/EpsC-like NDP-sugar epimerase
MTPLSQLTHRNYLIAAHDALATAFALLASFYLRFEEATPSSPACRCCCCSAILCCFSIVICFIFNLTTTKWRFISLPDALNILRAATVLTVALCGARLCLLFREPSGKPPVLFGRVTIVLYWFLQVFALSALRFGYRYFRTRVSAAMPRPKGRRRRCWSAAPPMPRCCCAGSKAAPSSALARRRAVAVGCRPRTVDTQCAGAGRDRRCRRCASVICQARQTDFTR